jgi:sulfate transport system ATP-binding protein
MELKNIIKTFGGFTAADRISFSIGKGKLIGLLGPSGSGKTTLLRIIAGLETANSGDILIDGQCVNNLPASKRNIGFVFQSYALFRYMSVYDNIAFGLEVQKINKAAIRERCSELIKLIGLEGLEKRRPHQLSGGQRQRVAFARALAPEPRVLLLDEPFAAIDAKVRKELRSWLRETVTQVGITSIFVTHDQDEAVEVADEIVILNNGHVEQIGSPADIYKNPTTPFAAKFIGESTVVENYGRLKGFEDDSGYTQAVLRPEFVWLAKATKDFYPHSSELGVVEDIFFRGNALELRLNVGGLKIMAYRSLDDEPFTVGETIRVLITKMYLYNHDRVQLVENVSFRTSEGFTI